jgi:hypothetical protein
MGGMQPSIQPLDPALRPRRPAGVTAAVWIAVGLAVFLVFSALNGVLGATVSNKLQDMQGTLTPRRTRGLPAEQAERMRAMQRRMTEAARPDQAVPVALVSLVVAGWTFVAAFRLHRGSANAAPWFTHAMIALALVEIIGLIQAVRVQQRLRPIMAEMMDSIPRAAHARPEASHLLNFVTGTMKSVATVSMMMGIAWAGAKIVVCLYARHCANKPEVRAWTAWSSGA